MVLVRFIHCLGVFVIEIYDFLSGIVLADGLFRKRRATGRML